MSKTDDLGGDGQARGVSRCLASDWWAAESTANEGNHRENDEDEEADFRRFVCHPRDQAEAKKGGDDGDHQEEQS
jgi:hypothetical protein